MQFKAVKLTKLQVKESHDGKTAEFEGYGSVFDNTDFYDDVVRRGAFRRSIDALKASGSKLVMLWQHFYDQPIGVWPEMDEDAKGLKVRGEINLETERGREAYALLKQGAVRGLSIGYEAIKWFMEEGKRILEECKLWEISLVTFPANELALVNSVKHLNATKKATEVQSVLCSKEKFKSADDARKWCEDHDYKAGDLDETDDFYRFRQFEPSECSEGSLRTIELTEGVKAVICKRAKQALLAEMKRIVELLQAPAESHACEIDAEASAKGHATDSAMTDLYREMQKLNAEAAQELQAMRS